jgi:flagellar assembly protein FliH
LGAEGRRKFLSNIFKRYEAQDIPIKPYQLREMEKGGPPEEDNSGVFKGLNEKNGSVVDPGSTPSQEQVEADEIDRERIAQIEKEAYEGAFKLGEKAGVERGEQMFRSAVRSFTEAAEQLKRMEQDFYRRVEGEILDLVLATTRKVVQREVESQKDVILHVLREAIARVIDRERILVRLNPSDYDLVHAHKSDILQAIDGIKNLVIERDEAISRGGAIVESDCGTIDARIERRLDEVEKALNRQRAGTEEVGNSEEAGPGEKACAN